MKKLLAILFVVIAFPLAAQIPAWEREDTIPGTSEWIMDAVQQPDGGYALVGYYERPNMFYTDNLVIRTNTAGDTLWTKKWGSTGYDNLFGVANTPEGGVVCAGAGMNNACKLDSAGNIVFSQYYPGFDFYDVTVMPDSGFVFAGYYGGLPNWADIGLVRTDKNGDTLWTKTIGGQNSDVARSIKRASDGNLIIAGYYNFVFYADGPQQPAQAVIMKINAVNGNIMWYNTINYATFWRSDAMEVIENRSGGFTICGPSSSNKGFIAAYSAGGNLLWAKEYANPEGSNLSFMFYSLRQKCDDGYLIGGYAYHPSPVPYSGLIVSADANGDTLFTYPTFGQGPRSVRSITSAADGGFFAAGYSFDTAASYPVNAFLMKLDGQGTLNSWNTVTAGFADTATGASVAFTDQSGGATSWYWDFGDGNFSSAQHPVHVYAAAGTYYVCQTVANACDTLVYCDSVNVPLSTGEAEMNGEITVTVFPQPAADGVLNVSLALPAAADVTIEVFDVSGKCVLPAKIVRDVSAASTVSLDVSALPAGVYMLRVTAGKNVVTKKAVIC